MRTDNLLRTMLAVNALLAAAIALLLFTPILDFRNYDALPEPDREWREIIAELEGFSSIPFRDRIENTRAYRTMRSVPIKRASGAITEYEVTGHGGGRVYFLHKKTNEMAGYSVGDVIEDYVIISIGEKSVELEKDDSRIEFPL